jgi:hypothetical protein
LRYRYWGFYHFSKAADHDEVTKLLYGSSLTPKFDFFVHAGQSLHWNPTKRAYRYKLPSLGYFRDKQYGPGMVTVWRDGINWYPEQDFTDYTDM